MKLDKETLSIDNIEFWGEHKGNKGGIRVSWSANIGFGTYDLFKSKDNELLAATESMDNEQKEFSKLILQKLLEKVKIID